MKIRSAAVVLLLLGAAGCDIKVNQNGVSVDIAEGRASDEWTRTYSMSPGGRVEIVNVNGGIQVTPAAGGQVEVFARREARTQDEAASKEILQKIEMVEEVAADRVKIQAKTTAWEGSFAGGLGQRPQVTVEYRLSVPPGLHVDLKTENGGLRLQNVNGSFVTASTNGGINARGVSGSFAAALVNGGIQVDLAQVSGDVSLVTVNGGVRLELPSGVKADLDVRAVNGGVSVDERLGLEATEQARLHIAGRLNGGGPTISAQTTNGGVRVSVREDSGASEAP